jgi:hypothetical protein
MKMLIGAFALIIAAPAAAQPAPADARAGHAQHSQHQDHKDHGQSGDHSKHKDCCKPGKDGKLADCCDKAKQQGKKMACCAEHGEGRGGEHKGHGA